MRIVAIVAFLLLNAYFVAAEFSLVRSRRTRLEAMARTGDRLAHLALRATAHLQHLLSASQLGITIASLALGALAEGAFHGWLDRLLHDVPLPIALATQAAIIAALAISIVTFFHVVIGELVPKRIALSHPEGVARWLAPPLFFFEKVVRPFTALLNASANGALWLLGQTRATAEEGVHSPDELRLLVEQGQESGALETTDANMLEGVFEFSEKNAREVMTPRTEIDARSEERRVGKEGRSRW